MLKSFLWSCLLLSLAHLTEARATGGQLLAIHSCSFVHNHASLLRRQHVTRPAKFQNLKSLSDPNSRRDTNDEPSHSIQKTPKMASSFHALYTTGIFLLTIMIITTMTVPPRVWATEIGDLNRGASLFDNNCASCHRGGQNIMKPAKTLQEQDLVKYLGSTDPSTLQKFFSNSLNHKLLSFPNVPGGKLTETDLVDVTTYISDMAKGSKWE